MCLLQPRLHMAWRAGGIGVAFAHAGAAVSRAAVSAVAMSQLAAIALEALALEESAAVPARRGWCELCCGRGCCGCCAGPFRRYAEAFQAGRWMPTLQVTNYMNHEAILQVGACCWSALHFLATRPGSI